MSHFNTELIRINDKNSLAEFLRQPTLAVAEGLTAILADPGQLKLAAGHLVQAAIKGKLLEQLGMELEELRKAGHIKEDYFATHKQQATLHELLKFIDQNPPDEEVFSALKSIFLSTVRADATSEDEQLGYHLLQLCKQLGSGEILILKASLSLKQKGAANPFGNAEMIPVSTWLSVLASETKLPSGLLVQFETKLMDLHLLQRRHVEHDDLAAKDCRLTELAFVLCEHITRF